MSLADLAKKLKEQDEMAPKCAYLWGVYDTDLVAVGNVDRIGDREWEYVWFDTDGTEDLIESDDELFDALDLVSQGDDLVTVNNTEYERLTAIHVPKLVSVFFSRQEARLFIDKRRHEFRKPYIESIYLKHNSEMLEVRQLIANTF